LLKQSGTPLAMPATREDLKNRRMLIVEDNETNRAMLQQQITAWGARSDTAGGATEALGMLRRAVADGDPYEIAVLDMTLPEMNGLDLARRIRSDPSLARIRLVLLVPPGRNDDFDRAQGAGVGACLAKPVRRSLLRSALLGPGDPAGVNGAPQADPPAQSVDGPPCGGRILLAEDNPINQRVAMLMLERLGFAVDAAGNGCQALAALEQGRYDLVLMDCQMPEMDGYEATRRIREKERLAGSARTDVEPRLPRIPIIALTGQAMDGDREECLAAGMDDYLAKPFTMQQLESLVQRWLGADQPMQG
jgi:CheY-like chemotaxis protein